MTNGVRCGRGTNSDGGIAAMPTTITCTAASPSAEVPVLYFAERTMCSAKQTAQMMVRMSPNPARASMPPISNVVPAGGEHAADPCARGDASREQQAIAERHHHDVQAGQKRGSRRRDRHQSARLQPVAAEDERAEDQAGAQRGAGELARRERDRPAARRRRS